MKMSPCHGNPAPVSPPNMLMNNTTTPDRLYYELQNTEKTSVKTKQADKEKKKRIQHCQRCENHGHRTRKSRHDCPYKDCQCVECKLTNNCQLMMKHQQRFWRWRKQKDNEAALAIGEEKIPSGAQRCDRCRNHGIISLKKGHKGNCEFVECNCEMCKFISKRQEYLKHNQRLKRKRSSQQQTVADEEKVLPEVKQEYSINSAPLDVTNKQRLILHTNESILHPSESILHSSEAENYTRDFRLTRNMSRSLSSMTLRDIEIEERKQSALLRDDRFWPLVPQPLKPMPIIPNPQYLFSYPYPYPYLLLRKF